MLLKSSPADDIEVIMANAKLLLKRRQERTSRSFVDLSVFEVPVPLKGSSHNYKYRLAYVVDEVCVLRYDNEAGKGDHKHIGLVEAPYSFRDVSTLLRDFFAEVERMEDDENS
ncbi:toxin-antitoxin system TumE family protein [Neorhizobium sp. LjRoot104]|uniref:toxin-antitoxin system TumE family protein n=1 Tax=Neorhizobium sp. LjRoot104 TaxID=3342254 RepID=UPI003ECE3F67